LLTDALTFLVMAAIARLMPGRPQNAGAADVAALSGPAGLLAGFRLLWQLRPVAVLTAVSVGVLFLHGMTEVFLPAFSKLTLHQGPAQYGLLVSTAEVASLGGTLLLAPLAGRVGPGPALAAMLAARGLAILPLAFAGSWALGVTLASAAAVPEGAVFPVLAATTQRLIPAAVRGRVQGAAGALGAAGFPLGSALGGVLVAAAGSRITAIVMAAGYLPLTAAVITARQLRRSRPGGHAAGASRPAPGEHVLRKPA
jgi:MFS family permease